MAKDSSFDVVSQIDMQEVDNAYGQAKKEISQLIKRGIELNALNWGKIEAASGATVRQTAKIIEGIDKETAGKINKDIKSTKLKVKVTIEGDKLRVSGPKIDTLQEVIAFLKDQDYSQPLQFVNYR